LNYKQQSLDLFKRFEIAVPQKKTEPVLQVGNEYNYKFIKFAPDATYIACAAFSREGMVIIRQFPSGKHLMQHRYKSFLNGFSDISDSNHAILWFEDRENYW
jgi:predicted PilT family ATPase